MNQKEKNDTLLEVLQYLHDVCKQNNLTYTLAYGTLLGAIRHQGFIPWDDDVDVFMPIEDYKKAIEIINNKNDGYEFLSCESHDNYPLSYGKITKNDTITIEESYAFRNIELGVNIDVFPLYPIDIKLFKNTEKEIKKYCLYYRAKALSPIKGDSLLKNICKQIIHFLMYFVAFNENAKKINELKYSCKGSEIYIDYNEYSEFKTNFTDFTSIIDVDFENKKFKAPSNYDKILTTMYGDYMTPPKENKRGSTHKNRSYFK